MLFLTDISATSMSWKSKAYTRSLYLGFSLILYVVVPAVFRLSYSNNYIYISIFYINIICILYLSIIFTLFIVTITGCFFFKVCTDFVVFYTTATATQVEEEFFNDSEESPDILFRKNISCNNKHNTGKIELFNYLIINKI